ncbi:hypothetical protein AXF42_Ash002885 [Apostasia shenzhenica]|uniref:Uncharacterized protein n=1 Tax=Apostasia shenzhenica TaxID=1088818 RepID=A0A2I0A7K0_9ASPA|nr:hypothetical protein AXF42_Ash002885 [Apostasia shenzhenica]
MVSNGMIYLQGTNAGDSTKFGGEEIIFQPKETLRKDQEDDIKVESSSITAPNLSFSDEKSQSKIVDKAKKEDGHDKETKILIPESGSAEPAASKEISKDEKAEVESPAKENPESSSNDINESVKSENSKNPTKEPLPAEIPNVVTSDASEEPGKIDVDINASTSIEVPVKDLEVESGSPEEQKQEVSKVGRVDENPAKEILKSLPDELSDSIKLEDSEGTTKKPEPAKISSEAGETEVNPNASASIEVPVKDLEVESGSPEEQKKEISHVSEKANTDSNDPSSIELPVKDLEAASGIPEEQKEEISAEVVTPVSEAPEKIVTELNAPTSTEVPLKDIGIESGSPEEQKQEKKEEVKQPSLNLDEVSLGTEDVVSPSSNEEKASGYAEEVEKKDSNLDEERTELPFETKRDLEAQTKVAQIPFDEGKVIEEVAPKNDDVSFKDGVKDSDHGTSDLKVTEISSEGDKLAEKVDTAIEDGKRGLVKKPADLSVTMVSSEEIKAPKAAEITKNVENDAAASEGGKESARDERKSEILKEEEADPVEVTNELSPKGSSEQVTEEENTESSKCEKDAIKGEEASEKIEEKKDETSKAVNVDEKKEEEAIQTVQTAEDKTEKVELGAEKEETGKVKDRDVSVTSEAGDVKIVKEVTKRDSNNIFAKFKRSIVKAKKAILGKSPSPKPVSSEVKDGQQRTERRGASRLEKKRKPTIANSALVACEDASHQDLLLGSRTNAVADGRLLERL